jgi:hypothetical protein
MSRMCQLRTFADASESEQGLGSCLVVAAKLTRDLHRCELGYLGSRIARTSAEVTVEVQGFFGVSDGQFSNEENIRCRVAILTPASFRQAQLSTEQKESER